MSPTRKPPGRKIRCPQGYSAFVPDPLPPAPFEWSPTLVRALSDADRLIGRLAGEGGRLPNPHVLVRPFVAREAVLSSRIEGTQATLGEILAAEAGAEVERSPQDLREVANYVSALGYGIRRLKKLPLSTRLIREIHEKLMSGVRDNVAAPGAFRRTQNWIGRPGSTLMTASYIPPPPEQLAVCMGELEKFLHEESLPPLVQIALAHYQFEAIHPFPDGNGRTGRIVNALYLVQQQLLSQPVLYLSSYIVKYKSEYYQLLRGVTENNNWHDWTMFMLTALIETSQLTTSKIRNMLSLKEDTEKKMKQSLGP